MGNEEFGQPPQPPQFPSQFPSQPPQIPTEVALAKVKGPAIALMAVAGFGVLLSICSLLMNLFGIGASTLEGLNDQQAQYFRYFTGAIGIASAVIGFITSGFIFFGASKMKILKGYGMAIAASIIAIIPCISPCCLVGMPIGIWALVVLMDQQVKATFS